MLISTEFSTSLFLMCAFVVLLIFAAEQLNCQNRSVKTTGINKKHITVDFSNNILS